MAAAADDDIFGLFATPTVAQPSQPARPSSIQTPPRKLMSPAVARLKLQPGMGGMGGGDAPMTPTAAAYQAARAGKAPTTPRGRAFRSVGQLFAEGKIDTATKGRLKDVIIEGASINEELDQMLATSDPTKLQELVVSATTKELIPENPFSMFSPSPKKASGRDGFERTDSFSNLRSPSKTAAASTADNWWDDDAGGVAAAATPPAQSHAPPAPPPKPKSSLSRQASTEADKSEFTGVGPSAGAGPSAGGAALTRGGSSSGNRLSGRRGSESSVSSVPEPLEGELYVREGHLVLKKWKQRFVTLVHDRISVFGSAKEYASGAPPSFTMTLKHNMGLSNMKVNASKKHRIFYRHMFDLKPGAVLGSGEKGHHRVWKFGADTMADFERWSLAFKKVLDRLSAVARKRERDALALDSAVAPADLMVAVQSSPRRRARRRSSVIELGGGDGAEALTLTVYTLDGNPYHVVVHKGATIRDVLVSFRHQIGLSADADFSLFLRDSSLGHEYFMCLPDSMLAEEADAQALSDTKALIYKRRITLPTPAPKAGVVPDDADGKDVDAEEAEATSPDQAAHRLAYVEAVYNVVTGNFLLEVEDALQLAAMHSFSAIESFDPSVHTPEHIAKQLPTFMSAEAMLEAIASGNYSMEDLAAAVLSRREELGSMSKLEAQRAFLKRVRRLPEYGSTFFHADLVRYLVGPLEESDVDPSTVLPSWLLDCTGASKAKGPIPPAASVLVAINSTGLFTRLCQPSHSQLDDVLIKHGIGYDKRARTGAPALAKYSRPTDWIAHQVQYVEVWGVKKTRPVFTYRVRELSSVLLVELQTPLFQEMASVLHMYVFNLLALREGKSHETARAESSDYGRQTVAAAKAAAEAEAEAKAELPTGWTEIRDPISGKTAFWNQHTRKTVWSRPTT